MKTFISFSLALFVSWSMSAQCEAYLNLGGTGSNLTVSFVASGAFNPQYIIDWGDGTADTSSTPFLEHNYTSDGQFVLFYTYQDLDNPACLFTSYDSVILTGGSCSMSFSIQTIALVAALEAFSDNTSIPIYSIDWGDGSPVEVADAALHEYAAPGNYLVCVLMYDADPTLPCELYQCQNIEITGEGSDCAVQVQAEIEAETATLIITGNGGASAEYFIDWGDGSFDENPILQHTYPIPNLYEVCVYYGLEANSACQTSACTEVNIDPAGGDCFFNFVPVSADLNVELEVIAAGALDAEYFFDWGDGSLGSFGLPATHTYSAAGTYEVCGSYTDLDNPIACQVNVCASVTVSSASGGCEVELTIVQTGSDVLLTAVGTGAAEPSYYVEWGDGSLPLLTATGIHTYGAEGAYEICVTYFDALVAGCTSTVCETILITGVDELNEFSLLNAWPNPVGDVLWIEFALHKASETQFVLCDAAGRALMELDKQQASLNSQRSQLDFRNVPAGMYLLECITPQGKRTLRVIK